MNVDFINANVDGNSAQVLVLASEQDKVALYIARENKGHKGIQRAPLENYLGTIIHDPIVREFEKRYDGILDLGDRKYLDDSPTDY